FVEGAAEERKEARCCHPFHRKAEEGPGHPRGTSEGCCRAEKFPRSGNREQAGRDLFFEGGHLERHQAEERAVASGGLAEGEGAGGGGEGRGPAGADRLQAEADRRPGEGARRERGQDEGAHEAEGYLHAGDAETRTRRSALGLTLFRVGWTASLFSPWHDAISACCLDPDFHCQDVFVSVTFASFCFKLPISCRRFRNLLEDFVPRRPFAGSFGELSLSSFPALWTPWHFQLLGRAFQLYFQLLLWSSSSWLLSFSAAECAYSEDSDLPFAFNHPVGPASAHDFQ
ncbi:hypothetical protein AVEN_80123-1, partial [Araneus ventricosus]